jgi:hypothetical protein
MPAHKNKPDIHRGMSSRRNASEFTGTIAVPVPAEPSTFTKTLYAPDLISQSCDENKFISPLTGLAVSGGGAPFRPVSQRAGNTETFETPFVLTRTVISARPGTTRGGRIITCTG